MHVSKDGVNSSNGKGEPVISVRLAGRDDAEWIADISQFTFSETFAKYNTRENMDHFLDKQFSKQKLIREVGAPGNIFLLAYLDGKGGGYGFLRENSSPPELGGARAIEIARIYAGQEMIGKGIGKALMQRCVEIAREKGYAWIWLGVWEHNRRAIEFYTKWGFEKFGEHIFMLGHDEQTDWMMKKRL
jgi:GNAT superfamily N-acetyltransferase